MLCLFQLTSWLREEKTRSQVREAGAPLAVSSRSLSCFLWGSILSSTASGRVTRVKARGAPASHMAGSLMPHARQTPECGRVESPGLSALSYGREVDF